MYKVILIAEDGEYVLSEHRTREQAIYASKKAEKSYGEGQRVIVERAR